MKWFSGLLIFLGLFWFVGSVQAAGDYRITDFLSQIQIEQNTDLVVTETISTEFAVAKHGIFRDLVTRGVRIGDISVSRGDGSRIPFTTSTTAGGMRIKIGDPDTTVTGSQQYLISYVIRGALKRFADHDELYWNAVGSNWDTPIERAVVTVLSPYAEVIKTACYFGPVGATELCSDDDQGPMQTVFAAEHVGMGTDLTIVVGLNPLNSLVWPVVPWWQMALEKLKYVVAVLPGLVLGMWWFFKGRDLRFRGDNVYVPAGAQRTVGVFEREHLPTQFGPIAGLTPSEVGTIVDQRVDMADIVAEIVELARLKYVEFYRDVQVKSLAPDVTDYVFVRTEKSDADLRSYQQELLRDLTNTSLYAATPEQLEHVFGGKAVGMAKRATALSKMKGVFRGTLDRYKGSLYEYLDQEGYFDGRPDSQRAVLTLVVVVGVFILFAFGGALLSALFGLGWMILFGASCVAAVIFAYHLPRRTAVGHAMLRQAKGLAYYLSVGKWRYEIAEKHLFLEEILPLAISLGVVDQLASDMKDLNMDQVPYMPTGMGMTHFGDFRSSLWSNLSYTPRSSGGSGFSGGFSGGGGGGGGGGSW